jgi:hypothetical protein
VIVSLYGVHRCHWYDIDSGCVPSQSPAELVKVCPTANDPDTHGGA